MNLENLKVLREKKNFSCKYMANRLEVTVPYYWMIENGKRGLSYEMAVKIARILDTTPDNIFLTTNLTTS